MPPSTLPPATQKKPTYESGIAWHPVDEPYEIRRPTPQPAFKYKTRNRQSLIIYTLLAVTLVLGLGVRVLDLGRRPLSFDEAASYAFSSQPVSKMLGPDGRLETNPPTYYIMLKSWSSAFGNSEAAMRSLSVVFGVLTIAGVFLLGRIIAGNWVGLAAALLAATADGQAMFSRTARSYAILAFAVTLASIGLAWLLREPAEAQRPLWKRPSRHAIAAWSAYAIGTLVALYMHNTAVLVPALATALGIVCFMCDRRLRPGFAANWAIVNGLVLLAFAWWVRAIVEQMGLLTESWFPDVTLAYFWVCVKRVTFGVATGRLMVFSIPVLLALAAIGSWRYRKSMATWLVLTLAVGFPVLVAVLSIQKPMLAPRVISWCPLFLFMLAAMAVPTQEQWATVRQRLYGVAVVGLLVLVVLIQLRGSYNFATKFQSAPIDEIAQAIQAQPGDAVVVMSADSDWPLRYYNPQAAGVGYFAVSTSAWHGHMSPWFDAELVEAGDVSSLAENHDRIWLFWASGSRVPEGTQQSIEAGLAVHGDLETRMEAGDVSTKLWVKR